MTIPLPTYSDEMLAGTETPEFVRLLIRGEDRVPRNVIDECVRRGEAMLDALCTLLDKDYYWSDDVSGGEWWLAIHAAMILGRIPGERAGELLAAFMRRLGETHDENRQSWLTDHWPAFFRNKPASAMDAVRSIAKDRELDYQVRADAAETIVSRCAAGAMLDEALAWVADIAFDETEDIETRALTGNLLIDFPRAEYRARLEQLARAQAESFPIFDLDNVRDAYRTRADQPRWEKRRDPWLFYSAEDIESRRLQWAKEDATRARYIAEDPVEPYLRETPKVGRNDPCPCGSGKKYKKCCMATEH
jgi:hypothetical protein